MSLPHGLSLQTLLHTLECVDVASAHESVHSWMIETSSHRKWLNGVDY